MVFYIEVLIKFLESRLIIFTAHTNAIKITIPKMADTSKEGLLSGGGICHIRATLQYHAHSNEVPACVSNIV